jgi:hypothetical protein
MPLLKWVGLVPFILPLWAIICIVPSLVALKAFHLTHILLLGDIVVSAIVVAMIMAICPCRVVIVVIPMDIMVVAISLVVLMPIPTIVVVVVSSIPMESRTSNATMKASLMHRFLILENMMLPLSVFRLLHLAF